MAGDAVMVEGGEAVPAGAGGMETIEIMMGIGMGTVKKMVDIGNGAMEGEVEAETGVTLGQDMKEAEVEVVVVGVIVVDGDGWVVAVEGAVSCSFGWHTFGLLMSSQVVY